MKSFKVITLFIVAFIAFVTLTVAIPLPDVVKSCSAGLGCTANKLEGDGGNSTSNSGNDGDNEIITPSAPDYNGSQLKKLAIPIGVGFGLVIGSIFVCLVWKWGFKRSQNTSQEKI